MWSVGFEYCGQVDGVRFVNDSKGTNPDASIKAVEAIDGGIVLIAGGYDKGSSYEELIKAFNGKVQHMVLLGKTAEKIKETGEKLGFTGSIIVKDMEECAEGRLPGWRSRAIRSFFLLRAPAGICTPALNKGANTLKTVSQDWKNKGAG